MLADLLPRASAPNEEPVPVGDEMLSRRRCGTGSSHCRKIVLTEMRVGDAIATWRGPSVRCIRWDRARPLFTRRARSERCVLLISLLSQVRCFGSRAVQLGRIAVSRSSTWGAARRGLRRQAYCLGFGLAGTLWPSVAGAADTDIRYSTIGYLPDRAKLATVLGGGTTFSLRRAGDGSEALAQQLGATQIDATTNESFRIADFSAVTQEGSYYLEVPGLGRSPDFPIRADVFGQELTAVMLGFFGWRSGTKVEFVHKGQSFHQGPGHMQDGLLDYIGMAGQKRDGSRGWYDAGDYGKYTVNGAFAAAMMLRAWESFGPRLRNLALQIPEHGGALPDYLAEIKWQYDWLLTMQYSEADGRVSHKLTSLDFAGFVMPEADVAATYYSPHGSAATAAFVAALAQGARVYAELDPALAARMLTAAQLSYGWLKQNTANVAPDISAFTTGAYGVRNDASFRLWAAAEIWETTGDAAALADFEQRANALAANDKVSADFDWGNPKNLGVYTYLLSSRSGKSDAVISALRTQLLQRADGLVGAQAASAYGRALSTYYWGVNGAVARTCMLLQVANQLSPKPEYLDCCVAQIAHLFGRNYYGRSFVTGEGKDPPLHPHHRPSGADGIDQPFPGLLVGGAQPMFSSWQDTEDDYTTNEVAINWNGALAYALAGFLPATASVNPNGGAGGNPCNAGASGGCTAIAGSGGAGASGAPNAVAGGGNASGESTAGRAPTASGGASQSSGEASGSTGCGCELPGHANTGFPMGLLLFAGAALSRRVRGARR